MKTNGWIFFVMCMIGFIACDDEEDKVVPPEVVENAFQTQFPTATSVKWERAGVFRKVDFKVDSKEYEAWYNAAGVWLQTETTENYANIPVAIKTFLATNGEYPLASWTPQNEVEVLSRLLYSDYYGVELEQGEQEVTIWADDEAFYHITVAEDFNREDTPKAIRTYILQKELNSWITQTLKWVNGHYQVNVLSGSMVKQFYFDASLNWLYAEWPVESDQLPDVVKAVLQGPAYTDYAIKSVTFQERTSTAYYHIVLENTNSSEALTIHVNIDPEGNIIS
jgi:hypothetical protein